VTHQVHAHVEATTRGGGAVVGPELHARSRHHHLCGTSRHPTGPGPRYCSSQMCRRLGWRDMTRGVVVSGIWSLSLRRPSGSRGVYDIGVGITS
jgi:hypothetical protein